MLAHLAFIARHDRRCGRDPNHSLLNHVDWAPVGVGLNGCTLRNLSSLYRVASCLRLLPFYLFFYSFASVSCFFSFVAFRSYMPLIHYSALNLWALVRGNGAKI
ncbi:hypothetical protein FA15DRAFT_268949 [Coprinopsis marcescibilis]|uniref:Uncharacterized protein n=1 Tax=Coprinopsis marcescibilis TaxID=230819 RepID=A0A5C3KEV3_COPMA|nr:hypothetical protein FA15DRAFT_268949 [Coprinopsis marcescibilis]